MTGITRISTKSFHQGTVNDMTRLQTELTSISKQISSGNNVQDFTELSKLGQTERVLGFQNQKAKVDNYIQNNTIINNRLQSYNTSVANIIDVAESLRNTLLLRRTPTTGGELPLQEIVQSDLATVKGNLNVQSEGRYLFSGGRTNTQPVGDTSQPNYTLNTAGEYDTNANYYQGDGQKFTINAADALEVEYGITADNPAFQKLFAAMQLAMQGDLNDDDSMLASAIDMVTASISDLSSLQANINNNITILDTANDNHEDFKLYLDQSISDITETDIGMASIDFSTAQTTLQAAFSVFSRISSLKLSDYLR